MRQAKRIQAIAEFVSIYTPDDESKATLVVKLFGTVVAADSKAGPEPEALHGNE